MGATVYICGWLTVLATVVVFWRAGRLADADRPGGRRSILWPVLSAAVWAACFYVLRRGFYVGLLLQIGLFFAIGYAGARKDLSREREQMDRLKRENEQREERFRQERERWRR